LLREFTKLELGGEKNPSLDGSSIHRRIPSAVVFYSHWSKITKLIIAALAADGHPLLSSRVARYRTAGTPFSEIQGSA
jgi:hypothetical protein